MLANLYLPDDLSTVNFDTYREPGQCLRQESIKTGITRTFSVYRPARKTVSRRVPRRTSSFFNRLQIRRPTRYSAQKSVRSRPQVRPNQEETSRRRRQSTRRYRKISPRPRTSQSRVDLEQTSSNLVILSSSSSLRIKTTSNFSTCFSTWFMQNMQMRQTEYTMRFCLRWQNNGLKNIDLI